MNSERRFGVLIVCMMMTAAVFAIVPANVSAQNDPPVADAGGPYTGPEGSEIVFDASGSYDNDTDPLQYCWDFHNDGIWDTSFSSDPTAVNIWYDDYTGIVIVNVTDGTEYVTDTADVTVTNVDPEPHGGDYGPVDEGEPIPFEVIFFDPGSTDWFTSFGMLDGDHDGTVRPNLVLDSIEYSTVTLHTTLDTNDYVVNDLELEALHGTMTSVTIFGNTESVSSPGEFYDYDFTTDLPTDTQVSVDIVMEPEANNTCVNQTEIWTLQWHITYDDEILSSGFFSNITKFCPLYFDKGIPDDCGAPYHTFNYTVVDDNLGIGTHLVQIVVRNVEPDVDAGPDQTVYVGDEVQFVGSFTDPGWLDTHTIEWYFGDGNTGDSLVTTHTYQTPGTYDVWLNVTDDDGGLGFDTLRVVVKEKPGLDILIIIAIVVVILVAMLMLGYGLKRRSVGKEDRP